MGSCIASRLAGDVSRGPRRADARLWMLFYSGWSPLLFIHTPGMVPALAVAVVSCFFLCVCVCVWLIALYSQWMSWATGHRFVLCMLIVSWYGLRYCSIKMAVFYFCCLHPRPPPPPPPPPPPTHPPQPEAVFGFWFAKCSAIRTNRPQNMGTKDSRSELMSLQSWAETWDSSDRENKKKSP